MSPPASATTSVSAQVYTELDSDGHPSHRLLCKPTPTSKTEQCPPHDSLSLLAHKDTQFSEICLEDMSIDTIQLDTFLRSQSKQLKKLGMINTHMHFLYTPNNICEPYALLTALASMLAHTLEVQSLEIRNLVVHYNDSISTSVTFTSTWDGVTAIRAGFAGLVAKIKQRGNVGLLEGQEVIKKPQSSFIETERWEDEYGFASDGEESDDDVYENEDGEWEM
ncbi:unnamed protein product [Aureobasidium uvarum]|uniref:Uncharacterized protein n=1 Tax=Aureobasidium uvarum TaxID=2773716 RepID=A0A9N8KMC0_9PEZI|nr:unnamed protein product [Aureobasidium uvarum]